MSRWEPVSESIRKREQSEGCGRFLIIVVVAIVCIAILFGGWTLGTAPRCYACSHYRHQNKICGAWLDGMGTCICEKDK